MYSFHLTPNQYLIDREYCTVELSYHSTHHHILRKFSCPYRIWLDNSILIIQMTKRFGQLLQIRKDIYFVLHESAEPGARTALSQTLLLLHRTALSQTLLLLHRTALSQTLLLLHRTALSQTLLLLHRTAMSQTLLLLYYTGQRYIETIKSIVKSKRFSLK